MRVLLLVLLVLLQAQGREQRESCGLLQNFMYNVQEMFWDPIVDRVTVVMYTEARYPLPVSYTTLTGSETCESIGADGGLNALAISFKLLTGYTVPLVTLSERLNHTIQSLDVCNRTSSLANLPSDYVAPNVCKMATLLMRCALMQAPMMAVWIVGSIVAVVIVFTVISFFSVLIGLN